MNETTYDALPSIEVTVRPSQALNAPTYIGSAVGIVLLVSVFLALPPALQSSATAFSVYIGLGLMIVIRAIWRYLKLACLSYRIDGERIVWSNGVLSRKSGSLEMFRIQNVTMRQTLFERLCGVGSVELETQDSTNPHLLLIGLRSPEMVRAWLTSHVQVARKARGFREFAMG